MRSQAALPVGHGPFPHQRVAFVENYIAGGYHPVAGHMGENIAAGVGRADIVEIYRLVAALHGQFVVEGGGRRRQLDAGEIERREAMLDELAEHSQFFRLGQQADHRFGQEMVEFLGAAGRGDDLGVLDQLIAPDVVGVGVGVDQLADVLCRRRRVAHNIEHFLGQREVEQCVDQQGFLAVDDQPGVRPAPATVGQQIGE